MDRVINERIDTGTLHPYHINVSHIIRSIKQKKKIVKIVKTISRGN